MIHRRVSSKLGLGQIIILVPLSFSGIYLAAEMLGSMGSSRSSNENAPTEQTVAASTNEEGRTASSPLAAPGSVSISDQGSGGASSGQGNDASGSSGGASRTSRRAGNPLNGTPSPPPAEDPGNPFSGSGSGGGNPGGAPAGAVPVDGGLSLLLAAGLGYGVKKAYNSRKHKVKAEN
jgi:hypothetical protein